MSLRITAVLNTVNGGLLGTYFMLMFGISRVLRKYTKTTTTMTHNRDTNQAVDFVNRFTSTVCTHCSAVSLDVPPTTPSGWLHRHE